MQPSAWDRKWWKGSVPRNLNAFLPNPIGTVQHNVFATNCDVLLDVGQVTPLFATGFGLDVFIYAQSFSNRFIAALVSYYPAGFSIAVPQIIIRTPPSPASVRAIISPTGMQCLIMAGQFAATTWSVELQVDPVFALTRNNVYLASIAHGVEL
jgi:hypothetical protein